MSTYVPTQFLDLQRPRGYVLFSLVVVMILISGVTSMAQAPGNDNFSSAATLTGSSGTIAGSNAGASKEIGEPSAGGAYSVWWRWTSPAAGRVTLDTIGSNFDTYLAVYTGNSLSSLTLVSADDDSGANGMSRVAFSTIVGTTYYFSVSGFDTNSGNIRLNWQFAAAPANDNFSNAITLSGNSGSVAGANVAATQESGEQVAGGTSSVWWRWTAPSSGNTTVDTIGSDFDTYLAVYTGSSVSTLSLIERDDDSGNNLASRLTFTAVAGTVYSIAVTGFSDHAGNIRLNWQFGATTPGTTPTSFTWESWRQRSTEHDGAPFPGTNNWIANGGTLSFSDRGSGSYIEDFVQSTEVFAVEGIRIEWEMRATIGTMLGYVGPYVLLVQDPGSGWNSTSIGAQVFYRWESGGTNGAALHAGRAGNPVIGSNPSVPGMNDGTFARHVVTVSRGVVTWSVNGQTLSTVDMGTAPYLPMRLIVGARLYDSNVTQTIEVRNLAVTTATPATTGPANDNFTNAATLSGASGTVTGSNVGATRETGEPLAGGGGATSVWWRWTPAAAGSTAFETIGSDFDTYLTVYTGSSLSTLSTVGQDDDGGGSLMSRVSFSAVAGRTYFIAVTGFSGRSGNVRLNWQLSSTDTTGPLLSITSHSHEQTVSVASITLSGTATDSGRGDNGISSVTVNGVRASGDTAAGSGGANWSRSLTLVDGSNIITIVARDSSAAQNSTTQILTITFSVSASTFRYSINDKGLFSSTIISNSGVNVGYGRIQPDSGNTTPLGMAIFGFREMGIFGFGQEGVLVTEAAVPASPLIQNGIIYAEQSGTVQTGVAIANPNSEAVTVTFVFRDSLHGGVVVGQGTTTIPANGQKAAFLNQAPFLGPSSLVGTFSFTASAPVGAVALRGLLNERAEFLITTTPVADAAAAPAAGGVEIAHFADGGGWATQLVLFNPTNNPLRGISRWWDSSGSTSSVDITGPFCSSGCTNANEFRYNIAAHDAIYLRTSGAAASARTGRISITPDSGDGAPTAFAIFSLRSGVNTVTEASVQAMTAGNAFRLYAETGTGIQTGLAVSAGSTGAVVNLSLSNADGSSTGLSGTITVPANGNVANFLNQIPGFTTIPSPFKGVLRVSGTGPFSVVGLRGRYNERLDFLITTTAPTSEIAQSTSAEMIFPHFAVGGGYSTQLILISGSGHQAGTIRLLNQSGGALNVTISTPQQQQTETFTGSFNATFASYPSTDQACRFTPVMSGTITLDLTTNSDGTVTGSAHLPSSVTAAVSPSSCVFFGATPVPEGRVSGTDQNLTGTFTDTGDRPYTMTFSGRRTGDIITASMTILRTFATIESSGTTSGLTPLSVSVTNIVLRKQ